MKGKEIFTGSKCYEREIERKREIMSERERDKRGEGKKMEKTLQYRSKGKKIILGIKLL